MDMMTVRRLRGAVLTLLLTGMICLTGCENGGHFTLFGYTTRPTFDESIRTVYVPTAQNISYRQGLEFDLTRAVIRELSANSPYRVTSDCRRADTELQMKIINRKKNVIQQDQLGDPLSAEMTLYVEVVWKDLRPGRVGDILSNGRRFDPDRKLLPGELIPEAPKAIPVLISPTATFAPEVGGSVTTAEKQMVDRAAAQVVSMMEIWR